MFLFPELTIVRLQTPSRTTLSGKEEFDCIPIENVLKMTVSQFLQNMTHLEFLKSLRHDKVAPDGL